MKSPRAAAFLALLAAGCAESTQSPLDPVGPDLSLGASGIVRVTNGRDSGPGSFRAALEEANMDLDVRRVQFLPGLTIELSAPVTFTGEQDLEIVGHGATLDGSGLAAGTSNFVAVGGGDLVISSMTFRDAPEQGMLVQIPAGATGTRTVVLLDVAALDNLGHGVEINDQEAPDDAGDPDNGIRGNSNGSDASLVVRVERSRFVGNGFGALDRDGLRINEGGLGDLTVSIVASRADANGADGVELDERGEGSLAFRIFRSHFSGNGDFDQSADPDKDDGFDADEGDAGDLVAVVMLSSANDNFEEGFDFNENDAGDMRVEMRDSEASGNPEEGVDLEEDDDWQGGGDLVATLDRVVAHRNGGGGGDGGIKIRERGSGELIADVTRSVASDNLTAGVHMREQHDGGLRAAVVSIRAEGNGAEGVFLREDDSGGLDGQVEASTTDRNGTYGVNFDENGAGDLAAAVSAGSASYNTRHGVRADEAGDGSGQLILTGVALEGNGSPGTDGNVAPNP